MEEITTFLLVVAEMMSLVWGFGLSIVTGGLPISHAVIMVFVKYSPYFIAFCLIVGLVYYISPKLKKR